MGESKVTEPQVTATCPTWNDLGKWVGDIFSLGIAASGEQTHVQAYVSVKVRCPGKNHIVALGFTLGRNRCAKQSDH